MHDSTLMPYISDAIGFLRTFSSNVSSALMSTSSHVPSRLERRADGHDHLLRVGHVVDAVERARRGPANRRRAAGVPRVVERDVGRARTASSFVRGAVERVLGDVVAGERAVRERLGHQQHGAAGAAADVGDRRTGAAACRPHRRARAARRARGTPGSTARSCARCRPRPRGRGCRSRGRRRCGSSRARARARASSAAGGGTCPCRTPGGPGRRAPPPPPARARTCRRRVGVDHLRRGLVVRPLAHPALDGAGRRGELGGRQRATGVAHRRGTDRAGRRGGSCRRSPRRRAW